MDQPERPLRVCLDARLATGVAGGVEQVVIGLAHGLCSLKDGNDDYLFLTRRSDDAWLSPYLEGSCNALVSTEEPFRESGVARAKQRSPVIDKVARMIPAIPGLRRPGPPASDGTIEKAHVDVMHFTFQHAFVTDVPSIYQPHDLQHVHLPRFFTPREREHRDRIYRTHCERAEAVVVMSRFGRDDLVNHLDIPREKIHVIPWAPILAAYGDPSDEFIEQVAARFDLPERFLLYPSHTHPHKNHLALLDALDILRERHDLRIPVICTGGLTPFYSSIRDRIERLGLAEDVRFLSYVEPLELCGLYKRALGLVFPSLFEGWGMPVCEAFAAGVPVASSTATMLPDLGGDAVIGFTPTDPESIAASINQLWTDGDLRASLIERGHARVADLSWERTAHCFRALYRTIGGRSVSTADLQLLESPPL